MAITVLYADQHHSLLTTGTGLDDLIVLKSRTSNVLYHGIHFLPWAYNLRFTPLLTAFFNHVRTLELEQRIDPNLFIGSLKKDLLSDQGIFKNVTNPYHGA